MSSSPPAVPAVHWRNAITRYGEEPPDQLLANPANPKIHPTQQQAALNDAIARLGWLSPVTVNERTGHVLDGHARIGIAISKGEPTVPVAYVDLDPQDEALALATFDPIGAMAVHDRDMLDALLREIDTDSPAIQSMLDDLAQSVGLVPGAGGALDLGVGDDEAEGFAEGAQFSEGAEVVIKLTREQANDADLKEALQAFCAARALDYKVKTAAKGR